MNLHLLGKKGIKYVDDTVPYRGRVMSYHAKPSFRMLNQAMQHDINSLPRKDRQSIMDADECRYTIGFEIEKTKFRRGAVRRYPLFCGFEKDSSCGVEAVTNVLPLLPPSEWRTKVFSLFYDAEKIIDSKYSPTDFSCGGHITIGIKGLSGDEIVDRLRPFMGIIYALFRKRLLNTYCKGNLTMQLRRNVHDVHMFNGWGGRYQAFLSKHNCAEFRLISRVDSIEQMLRRYELIYTLVRESGKRGMTVTKMYTLCSPIIRRMYNELSGDELDAKVSYLHDLSLDFQSFINNYHDWRNAATSREGLIQDIPEGIREFVLRKDYNGEYLIYL